MSFFFKFMKSAGNGGNAGMQGKAGSIVRLMLTAFVLSLALPLAGCGKTGQPQKIRDLEFTVVEPDEIPQALADVIAENKQKEMKLSYQKDGYLYLSRGFGEQATGGYSIAVKECYLAEDGVYVGFELIGPSGDKEIKEEPSYPYIVIKTEAVEGTIHFTQ